MQKPKQVRQVENIKEQLRITKVELKTVNNELSEALSNKESVLDSIKDLEIKQSIISKDSADKLKNLRIRKIELDNKETYLSMKEDDISKIELDSIVKIESEQKKLEANKLTHTQKIKDFEFLIEIKEKKLSKITKSVKDNSKIEKKLVKEVDKLSKDKSKLDSKLVKLEINYSEDLIILDNLISKKTKELDSINNQILEEQQKIGSADKAIKKEHKKLERRKKNLDVIIARFNKTFKKNYPALELKV